MNEVNPKDFCNVNNYALFLMKKASVRKKRTANSNLTWDVIREGQQDFRWNLTKSDFLMSSLNCRRERIKIGAKSTKM